MKPCDAPVSKSVFVSVNFTPEEVEAILIREAKAKINRSSVLYYGEIEKYRTEDFSVSQQDGALVMFLQESVDTTAKPSTEKETE